mmetsp:Transcript_7505/g.27403  ORF Transcript_7505/g.27403 Transcript_7505/m.27403 type:complete len:195 (-) Transcript_7505:1172-1756(-)
MYCKDFCRYPTSQSERFAVKVEETFEDVSIFGSDISQGGQVKITAKDETGLVFYTAYSHIRSTLRMLQDNISKDISSEIFHVSRFKESKMLPKPAMVASEDDRGCEPNIVKEAVDKSSKLLGKVKHTILQVIPDASEHMDTPLLQLGADSLTLAEICSAIKSLVHVNMSVIDLFELKTASAILEFVAENHMGVA